MSYVDPKTLYAYARKFADRAERSGRGTQFPTVRLAAKRFRCKQADILMSVEDGAGLGSVPGYFGISVGRQIAGVGHASHDREGDYEIEAYVT